MRNHDGDIRCFWHLSEAWYGKANLDGSESVDEITLGFYSPDGGTTGEFVIRWMPLAGKVVPRLEAFDDGWHALAACRDVLAKLGGLDSTAPSPAAVCALLLECGFADKTPRQRGVEVPDAAPAPAQAFDVTDAVTIAYGPCPNCRTTHGMGLVTRASQLAVECDRCGHRGPEVAVPPPSEWASWPVSAPERDRRAVEGWNDQSKNPAAYGLRRR